MAKKTAPKKKAAPVKAKAAKTSKSVKPAKKAAKAAKPAKTSKAKKATVVAKKPAKASLTKAVKPALMTKKGKIAKSTEEAEVPTPRKSQTIVSMMESSSEETPAKVEKVSKVRPIKIERGNLADEKAKWIELNRKYGKEKAINYKMTETYPSLVPLQHKVLGWGYILTNENDRLEVLFENGIRMLISNYKS